MNSFIRMGESVSWAAAGGSVGRLIAEAPAPDSTSLLLTMVAVASALMPRVIDWFVQAWAKYRETDREQTAKDTQLELRTINVDLREENSTLKDERRSIAERMDRLERLFEEFAKAKLAESPPK